MGEHIVSKTTKWFQCLIKCLSIMQQYSMKAPAKTPVEVAVDGFSMCEL